MGIVGETLLDKSPQNQLEGFFMEEICK